MHRPLWLWSRMTGWRKVVVVMNAAGLYRRYRGRPAHMHKGPRHAYYGLAAVLNGVPLHMLRKWMGHAKIETTAICLR